MSEWIVAIIIGGIGLILVIATYIGLIINVRRKQKGSVIPLVGAILLLVAGLSSEEDVAEWITQSRREENAE